MATPWHLEELEKQAAEEAREVVIGDFTVTPSAHHPFVRIVAKSGDLPKPLRGEFTDRNTAIRVIRNFLKGGSN